MKALLYAIFASFNSFVLAILIAMRALPGPNCMPKTDLGIFFIAMALLGTCTSLVTVYHQAKG